MSGLHGVLLLVGKDVRHEWRSKEVLTATVSFALIALTVINFGFEPGRFSPVDVGPGILWTAFLFAALLGMNRLFQAEHERGGLEGLMLCPVERTTLYVAKCVSLFVLLAVTAGATLFLFILFFRVRLVSGLAGLAELALVALLGCLGLAALGTSFAAMAARTRAREALLPVLVVPIAIPLLIAAVKCTGATLAGDGLADARGWVQLLLAFDAVFLAAGYATFPAIIEE